MASLWHNVRYIFRVSGKNPGFTAVAVRGREDPEAMTRAVKRDVESLGYEYEYPVGAKTIAQDVSNELAADRVVAALAGFFAVLALLLASVGLYGLTSYTVTRRNREVGIRAALGARPSVLLWTILRDTLVLVLAGLAIGVPCALAAGRLIARMLFRISPSDFPTILLVSSVLLGVAVFAAWLPRAPGIAHRSHDRTSYGMRIQADL